MKKNKNLKVSIIMGSQSDYKTMHLAEKILKNMGFLWISKEPNSDKGIFLFFMRHKIKKIAIGIAKKPTKLSLIGYISTEPI